MQKKIFTIILIICISINMIGCSKSDDLQSISESNSSRIPESIPESNSSQEENISDDRLPVSDEISEELYNIMKKTVEQYKNGEITPDEHFTAPPEDFVFPDSWGKDDLDISRRETMGDYIVVLKSSDNKYSMRLVANNFKYVDANGTHGGDMVIDIVEFINADEYNVTIEIPDYILESMENNK